MVARLCIRAFTSLLLRISARQVAYSLLVMMEIGWILLDPEDMFFFWEILTHVTFRGSMDAHLFGILQDNRSFFLSALRILVRAVF